MRDLISTNHEQAKKVGWQIIKPLNCEVVGKSVYSEDKDGIAIMKSTKRFKVDGGWVYNTTTEIHKGAVVTCAEALCFVPKGSN